MREFRRSGSSATRFIASIAALLALSTAGGAAAQAPNTQAPRRHAGGPIVSPDGRRILFYGDSGMRIMNADGSDQQLVRRGAARVTWFADSKRVVVVEPPSDGGAGRLSVQNLDGTAASEIPVRENVVSVSPLDAGTLFIAAFPPGADMRNSTPSFRIIDLDGHVLRSVTIPETPGRIRAVKPSWDGRRVAFVAAIRDTADASPNAVSASTLYVMDIDGTNIRALGTFANFIEGPAWSFDNTRLAVQNDLPYQHDARGAPLDWNAVDADIVVMDVASGRLQELRHTGRTYLDETPAWSPDGRIFIQSSRDGVMEIYRIDADGSNPRRLTR